MPIDSSPDIKPNLKDSVASALISNTDVIFNSASFYDKDIASLATDALGLPSTMSVFNIDTHEGAALKNFKTYVKEVADFVDLADKAPTLKAKHRIELSVTTHDLLDTILKDLNPAANSFDALLAHIIDKIRSFTFDTNRVISFDLTITGPVYRFSLNDLVTSANSETIKANAQIVCFKTDWNRILTYTNFTFTQLEEMWDINGAMTGLKEESYTDEEHLNHDYASFVDWFDNFLNNE